MRLRKVKQTVWDYTVSKKVSKKMWNTNPHRMTLLRTPPHFIVRALCNLSIGASSDLFLRSSALQNPALLADSLPLSHGGFPAKSNRSLIKTDE